jgi:hypothetical protein
MPEVVELGIARAVDQERALGLALEGALVAQLRAFKR